MQDSEEKSVLLMADDDEDDRYDTKLALEDANVANEFRTVEDGEELLDYLYRRGKYADPKDSPRPGVILLDLNMPRVDGRKALETIKSDPDLRKIPVVILTTSKADEDVLRTMDLGANSFIQKPVSFDRLVEIMKSFGNYWFDIVEPIPKQDN